MHVFLLRGCLTRWPGGVNQTVLSPFLIRRKKNSTTRFVTNTQTQTQMNLTAIVTQVINLIAESPKREKICPAKCNGHRQGLFHDHFLCLRVLRHIYVRQDKTDAPPLLMMDSLKERLPLFLSRSSPLVNGPVLRSSFPYTYYLVCPCRVRHLIQDRRDAICIYPITWPR